MNKKVVRTERGWAGHFCASLYCSFRRNTLLECGDIRIVISTVGAMRDFLSAGGKECVEIGPNRMYETMAFLATEYKQLGCYWEADVAREIVFESPWTISQITDDSDARANEMHETVVEELTESLKRVSLLSERIAKDKFQATY